MSKKFTSVSIDHEKREAVAVTVNGDGKIISVDKSPIPVSKKEPDMVSEDKAQMVFES